MNEEKVIKILDGSKILKSDNNFKTFEIVPSIAGYKVVKSSNKITEITLKYLYGEKKALALIQEFKKINKIIFNKDEKHNDGYGRAFEVFALAVLLEKTYEQVLNYVINGNYDGKIDGIVWNDEQVSIYQIKMNSKLEQGVLEEAKKNYKEYLIKKTISAPNCSHLKEFLEKNYDNIKDKSLKVCSITNSPTNGNNICSKDIFTKFFNNVLLPLDNSNIVLKIKIDQVVDSETNNTHSNYASTASNTFLFAHADDILNSLYEQGINTENSDKLFYDNVRGFIGINIAMQDTIVNNPNNFELYNNGLSILGDSKITATNIVIKNPTIINGQQTLFNLMYAKENHKDLSKIIVPVFVKTLTEKKERLNIARFNNSQKQVKDIDLLSINSELREIQENLLYEAVKHNFESGYYYLQLVSNGRRMANAAVKNLFSKYDIISLTDFIRIYWVIENKKQLGSWKNNVSKMINNEIIEKNYQFNFSKAKKTCDIISKFFNYLDTLDKELKGDYQSADVAFMFLLNSYDIETSKKIIDYINETIKDEVKPSKLIDLYKSNNVELYINKAKKALGIR